MKGEGTSLARNVIATYDLVMKMFSFKDSKSCSLSKMIFYMIFFSSGVATAQVSNTTSDGVIAWESDAGETYRYKLIVNRFENDEWKSKDIAYVNLNVFIRNTEPLKNKVVSQASSLPAPAPAPASATTPAPGAKSESLPPPEPAVVPTPATTSFSAAALHPIEENSELATLAEGDVFRWDTLKVERGGGGTNQSQALQKEMAFKLWSLERKMLPLPKFQLETIADATWVLHFMRRSLSEATGIDKLSQNNDTHTVVAPLLLEWDQRGSVLQGRAALQSKLTLKSKSSRRAKFDSSWFPMKTKIIEMPHQFMQKPIYKNVPNNYFEISKVGHAYQAQWGFLQIEIKSDVIRRTGRIKKASLERKLRIIKKVGCNKQFTKCDAEYPVNGDDQVLLKLKN
jgi:hypothetical protein